MVNNPNIKTGIYIGPFPSETFSFFLLSKVPDSSS